MFCMEMGVLYTPVCLTAHTGECWMASSLRWTHFKRKKQMFHLDCLGLLFMCCPITLCLHLNILSSYKGNRWFSMSWRCFWRVDVMAGASLVILDPEVTLRMESPDRMTHSREQGSHHIHHIALLLGFFHVWERGTSVVAKPIFGGHCVL